MKFKRADQLAVGDVVVAVGEYASAPFRLSSSYHCLAVSDGGCSVFFVKRCEVFPAPLVRVALWFCNDGGAFVCYVQVGVSMLLLVAEFPSDLEALGLSSAIFSVADRCRRRCAHLAALAASAVLVRSAGVQAGAMSLAVWETYS